MSKHTPGPWTATRGYTPSVVGEKSEVIAANIGGRIVDSLGGVRLGEVDANARLIAAAPDLLAAAISLRAALSRYDIDRMFGHDAAVIDAFEATDAAIRKATEGK